MSRSHRKRIVNELKRRIPEADRVGYRVKAVRRGGRCLVVAIRRPACSSEPPDRAVFADAQTWTQAERQVMSG